MRTCLLMLLSACASESGLNRLDFVDRFHQEGSDQVDALWVVDDSRSMADEQERLAQGFDRFLAALDDAETPLDLRVGVVTTDMDNGNPQRGRFVGDPPWLDSSDPLFDIAFMQRVHVGTDGSDKERGLEAAWALLQDEGQTTGFLRDSATLALAFVSDENDCSDDGLLGDGADGAECYRDERQLVPVRDYILEYQGLKSGQDNPAKVVASGIVGPEAKDRCEGSWPGKRYMTVADKLDGVVGDICEADFGDILDAIGRAIIAPTRSFPLTWPPLDGTIEVSVDDEAIPEDTTRGWWYDQSYQSIRFDGDYVPEQGSEIVVHYVIAGG